MPVGLVVMRWDERVGTEILAKYPEEVNVTDKTLMQVYSTHEYSGESGMISLMIGSLNIASYYTGPDKGFYILLLLSLDDDPDSYEGGLIDISRIILQNMGDDAYVSMIPTLFRRLSVYPTLNNEQRLAITYQDEIKRMILNRLRDEGVVSKSELMVWLKDQYKQGFVDFYKALIQSEMERIGYKPANEMEEETNRKILDSPRLNADSIIETFAGYGRQLRDTVEITDTSKMVNDHIDEGRNVLLDAAPVIVLEEVQFGKSLQ